MPTAQRRFWQDTWFAAMLFLTGAAATAAALSRLESSEPPPEGFEASRILYLVPPDIERENIPVSLEEFDDYGITVVHSYVDLHARVGSNTIGILIDRDSLAEIQAAGGGDWVRKRYAEGKVVGGMRIDSVELALELGVGPGDGQMFRYTPGRVFFATAYEQVGPEYRCAGASSDFLDRGMAINGLKRMVRSIERSAVCGPS